MNTKTNISANTEGASTESAKIEKLWDAIGDMERPVEEVTDFLTAIILIASNLEADVTSPLATIANTAKALVERIEEQREECFDTLHGIKFGTKRPEGDEVSA